MGTQRRIVLLEKDVTKQINLLDEEVGRSVRDFELFRLISRMSLNIADDVKNRIENELQIDLFEENGRIKIVAFLMK